MLLRPPHQGKLSHRQPQRLVEQTGNVPSCYLEDLEYSSFGGAKIPTNSRENGSRNNKPADKHVITADGYINSLQTGISELAYRLQ